MTGDGWHETVFPFYTPEGATALAGALERFEGGRLVVNVVDMPIKCPVAPLEFAFLADWYLHGARHPRRVRAHSTSRRSTARSRSRSRRRCWQACSTTRTSGSSPSSTPVEVDGAARMLCSYDEREVPFDLLVTVPAPRRRRIRRSLARPRRRHGFVPADPNTLQAKAAPNVFAIGDATNLPTSKAGSVTHFEARHAGGERRALPRRASRSRARSTATPTASSRPAFSKALLIDFNYDVEPLPGPYPVDAPRPAPAAAGVPLQPPRQAAVPVGLLARAAARARHPRHQRRSCRPPPTKEHA